MWPSWSSWTNVIGTFVRITLSTSTLTSPNAFPRSWCVCQKSAALQVSPKTTHFMYFNKNCIHLTVRSHHSPLVIQGSWSTSLWSSSPCCLRQYCTPVSQVWTTTGQAPPPVWQRVPPLPTSSASLENTLPIYCTGAGCYSGVGLPVPSSFSSHECDKKLFYAFCLD